MKTVIVDLDGTLCDNKHREHMIAQKDWDGYFLACSGDLPKLDVINVVSALYAGGNRIHIFSGRGAIAFSQTREWLNRHGVIYHELTMRDIGDYTADEKLKKSWCERFGYTPQNVLCILDDRNKVVDMWRAEGFTCLQVAPGDF